MIYFWPWFIFDHYYCGPLFIKRNDEKEEPEGRPERRREESVADLTDYMSGSRDPIIDKMQHLASFLLIRGPYAWLGWAWLGCGNFPYRPKGTSCGKGFFFPVMEYWRAPSDILFCARLRFVLLLLFALFYVLDDTFWTELDVDYGTPLETCHPVKGEAGVFAREYTKSSVRVDCNKWEGTVTMKK